MSGRHGFTLIELLVVIGLIALLMGLVLPVLSKARQRGRATVCMSNQRQLALAMTVYADSDSGKHFPRSRLPATPEELGRDGGASWVYTLRPHLGLTEVTRCPSDDSPYWDANYPFLARARAVSYGTNAYLSDPDPGDDLAGTMDEVLRPTHTIVTGELTESRSGYAVCDRIRSSVWAPDVDFQYPRMVETERHENKPHYSFVDGHVAPHARQDVYAYKSHDEQTGVTDWIANKFDPRVAK